MDKFLERFKPKKPAASSSSSNSNSNPFTSFLNSVTGGGSSGGFQGTGQSLGGKLPGQIIPIELAEPGPLGIKIEKRPQGGTAIVSMVIPDSQAERAGLQRGDILCFAGTDGREEIQYQEFLHLAQSDQRPLCLEVRRIVPTHKKSATAAAAENPHAATTSADAFARKQAVIAAAEAREKAAQRWNKPMARKTATTLAAESGQTTQVNNFDESDNEPKSEASRLAAEAAKRMEAETAAQLGYNPYETNKVTAGQARNATVAMTHGTLDARGGGGGASPPPSLPTVSPPRDPTSAVGAAPPRQRQLQHQQSSASSTSAPSNANGSPPPSSAFEQAFETLVTSNAHDDAISSISILQKLLVNASTKGQAPGSEAAKFRRVRLANPKIAKAIVETEGALDLMMSTGFALKEEEGESVLVLPEGNKGPDWLPSALDIMQKYEKS